MKLLYVDVNASFLNPTRNLLPATLRRVGDVRFFGPGYVNDTVLSAGLEAFVDTEGPFDVVLSNMHVIMCDLDGDLPTVAQYRRGYDFAFPASQITELPKLAHVLERLSIPRVALLFEADTYNWRAVHIEALEKRSDYAIGGGVEFTPLKSELHSLERERFASLTTDHWANWVRRNPQRVASLIHFVGDEEFGWDLLQNRAPRWAVLGVQYDARRTAAKTLQRSGVQPLMESPVRRGVGLLKRLGLMRKERRFVQRYLNIDSQLRLQACRYAYTCGSAINLSVRKFVEIPAAGTVLVCKPFAGFEAAGFRDGENAIACPPECVVDVHRMLEADQERAQVLADAGRELVWRHHSLQARAQQFGEVFRAMAQRQFAGARWVNGKFSVLRRQ